MLEDYLTGTTSFQHAQRKRMDGNDRVSGQIFQEIESDRRCRFKLSSRTCISCSS